MVGAMLMMMALAFGPDLAEAARREVARQECRLKDEATRSPCAAGARSASRYQVTDPAAPYDPGGNVKGVMTERMGWIAEGDSGIGSCSNIGPSAGHGLLREGVAAVAAAEGLAGAVGRDPSFHSWSARLSGTYLKGSNGRSSTVPPARSTAPWR
jgi:hypothetical protein